MTDVKQSWTDKEILRWFYGRLTYVHNENPHYDYMIKLKSIIEKMPDNIVPEEKKPIFNNKTTIFYYPDGNRVTCGSCGSAMFKKAINVKELVRCKCCGEHYLMGHLEEQELYD